jgi:hypothetical protein
MNRLMMLASAFAVLANQVFAQSNNCSTSGPECFEQGLPLPENKVMKSKKCMDPANKCSNPNEMYPRGYSASAAIMTKDSWDLDVGASFIYWYANQDDMVVASQTPTIYLGGSALYQNFGFNPGFKVNGAWDTDYDGWSVAAQYTWLHQSQSTEPTKAGSRGDDPGSWRANDSWYLPAGIAGDPFTTAASKWKLQFNQIDFTVGRPYYHGHHLTVSPSGGFRTIWMTQSMNIDMTGGIITLLGSTITEAKSNNSQSSWALGPMASVISHWNFWKAFRLEGKVGGSVLYTNWTKVKHSENLYTAAGQIFNSTQTDDLNAVRPTVDMGFGVGAGGYFYDCSYFLDVAVRYDFSVFFGQNMMPYFVSTIADRSPADIGDLMMQGLTVDLNFNF